MKGISPIVAAVILVAFVISIGLLVFGWMATLTRTTSESVSDSTITAVGCGSARVSIDTVYITGSSSSAIVKNNGFKNVTITGAQYISKTGGNVGATVPVSLPVGSITALSFSSGIISCSTFSQIAVSTDCGGVGDTFTGTPICG